MQIPGSSWAAVGSQDFPLHTPGPHNSPWAGWPIFPEEVVSRGVRRVRLLLGGRHNECAQDAGVSKGLAGAEPGETQGPARGGCGGGRGKPRVQCREDLSLSLGPGLRRAPAGCGSGAWRLQRRYPPPRLPQRPELVDSFLPFKQQQPSGQRSPDSIVELRKLGWARQTRL